MPQEEQGVVRLNLSQLVNFVALIAGIVAICGAFFVMPYRVERLEKDVFENKGRAESNEKRLRELENISARLATILEQREGKNQ